MSTSRPLIILFLLLLGGAEIMSILSMTGILAIPGVRWDIMPALCSTLTMLACILTLESSPFRHYLPFILIGILSFIIANIGLRPWAPSLLYSGISLGVGIAAFTAGYKKMTTRS